VDVSERQSVWQYLSVYSIYQDRVPSECGNLTPDGMFKIIDDTLKGSRYTRYYEDPPGGSGGGATIDTAILPIQNTNAVYIYIPDFMETGYKFFIDKRAELSRYRNIIIDLRYNGGGYVNAADTMVGEFLPNNTEYIRIRHRDYNKKDFKGFTKDEVKRTRKNHAPILTGKKVAVLVNEYSASASEILAAALRDKAGAHLVGSKTYGKGIGQVRIPRDGRKTLLITSMNISGLTDRTGDYHRKGIEPDTIPKTYRDSADTFIKRTADTYATHYADSLYPNPSDSLDSLKHKQAYQYVYRQLYPDPETFDLYCAIKMVESEWQPKVQPKKSQERGLSKVNGEDDEFTAVQSIMAARRKTAGTAPVGLFVDLPLDPLE